MEFNPESILASTKKILGLSHNYTVFDLDIITHINSVLSTLEQLGVGPVGGFSVQGYEELWDDLAGSSPKWRLVRTYVFLRVRLIFDPPTTSFAITAMEKQIQEMEWRLMVSADPPPEGETV